MYGNNVSLQRTVLGGPVRTVGAGVRSFARVGAHVNRQFVGPKEVFGTEWANAVAFRASTGWRQVLLVSRGYYWRRGLLGESAAAAEGRQPNFFRMEKDSL